MATVNTDYTAVQTVASERNYSAYRTFVRDLSIFFVEMRVIPAETNIDKATIVQC